MMDTKVVEIVDGRSYNKYKQLILPCKICGDPTTMRTKLCDWCWELDTRIRIDKSLAHKILNNIDKEKEVK